MRIIVRPTSRPAWAGAAAVALVVGLVAGCSGGGAKAGPSSSSPRTSSPSSSPAQWSSPSPSLTPDAAVKPVRPAAMDQVSAAGAEAVAVYFVNLFPYVFASGDLTEWKAMSHAECVYCANVLGGVKKMIAAGNRSEGGLVQISAVQSTVITAGRWWSVDLDMAQAPSVTVDGSGKVVEDFPEAKNYHWTVAVVYDAGNWVVRELSYTRTD